MDDVPHSRAFKCLFDSSLSVYRLHRGPFDGRFELGNDGGFLAGRHVFTEIVDAVGAGSLARRFGSLSRWRLGDGRRLLDDRIDAHGVVLRFVGPVPRVVDWLKRRPKNAGRGIRVICVKIAGRSVEGR